MGAWRHLAKISIFKATVLILLFGIGTTRLQGTLGCIPVNGHYAYHENHHNLIQWSNSCSSVAHCMKLQLSIQVSTIEERILFSSFFWQNFFLLFVVNVNLIWAWWIRTIKRSLAVGLDRAALKMNFGFQVPWSPQISI